MDKFDFQINYPRRPCEYVSFSFAFSLVVRKLKEQPLDTSTRRASQHPRPLIALIFLRFMGHFPICHPPT